MLHFLHVYLMDGGQQHRNSGHCELQRSYCPATSIGTIIACIIDAICGVSGWPLFESPFFPPFSTGGSHSDMTYIYDRICIGFAL